MTKVAEPPCKQPSYISFDSVFGDPGQVLYVLTPDLINKGELAFGHVDDHSTCCHMAAWRHAVITSASWHSTAIRGTVKKGTNFSNSADSNQQPAVKVACLITVMGGMWDL